jgi:hypothetical protein
MIIQFSLEMRGTEGFRYDVDQFAKRNGHE